MTRITAEEKGRAAGHARDAMRNDARGDVVARDNAIHALWCVVGYWRQSRQLTTAEYRGCVVPAKMLRMPKGRSLTWGNRWSAVTAWAATNGGEMNATEILLAAVERSRATGKEVAITIAGDSGDALDALRSLGPFQWRIKDAEGVDRLHAWGDGWSIGVEFSGNR